MNTCRDHLRRRARHPVADPPGGGAAPPEENLPAGPSFDPEEIVGTRDLQARVQTAISGLPPRFRDVVLLHDIQGLDYGETASALGIALGTVKSRLNRARLRLAKELETLWNS